MSARNVCGMWVGSAERGAGPRSRVRDDRPVSHDHVDELFVQPAAGDSGTSLGAATYVAAERGEVEASGATLAELLVDLDRRFPGIRFRMIDEQDTIRRHMKIFVNRERVLGLDSALVDALMSDAAPAGSGAEE